jgi:alpha-L-fucosidase
MNARCLNTKRAACLAALLAALAASSLTAADKLELGAGDGPFQPAWESLKQYRCPDWFRDAKLGIWAVWGPEAVPTQGDWYARHLYEEGSPDYQYHVAHYGHPSRFGYKDIIPLWKAEHWDPDQLMALYKKAGAKYFCVIAQHHDNFDCWNSRFHKWNSVNMGPRRDVVGEWKRAADKYGLRFGVTEHLGASYNWYNVTKQADKAGPLAGVPYDGADPRFADLYHAGNKDAQGWLDNVPETWKQEWYNRIKDLVDSYRPDLLYSDSGFPFDETGRRLVAHFYNQNLRDHYGKLEAVYNCKQDSQGMWVQDVERGIMGEVSAEPWQTDTCVGDWYYDIRLFEQHRYKSATLVLQMLADIVSKNGNLLLNLPPRPDGTLDGDELKILDQLAKWMPICGEAIFGTRPWKVFGEGPSRVNSGSFNEGKLRYTAQDIRFTTKGPNLYALALGWPDDRRLIVRSLATSAGKVRKVSLLGYGGKLAWEQTDAGLVVTMPEKKPCDHVFAFRIIGSDLKPVPVPVTAKVVTPQADGRIVLRAAEATIHGSSPLYEEGGGKDQIGYWGDAQDFVSWNFKVSHRGVFAVSVTYSCDPGAEGSEFLVEVNAQKLIGTSKPTGSWAEYTTESLGQVTLDQPGTLALSVKPKIDKASWKVIGLKSVILTPLGNGEKGSP